MTCKREGMSWSIRLQYDTIEKKFKLINKKLIHKEEENN